ncbi:MAG: hypothetical protein K2X39_10675 [Silvanigrellaceae bacterium]|nr:hypothetical protein [Silvanigrellaceae bacterium]
MATTNNNPAQTNQATEKKAKIHPWRLCPVGEHWVSPHSMHVPPSKKHTAGYETMRRGHCARNPSGKDVFYPEEINKISEQNFTNVKPKTSPLELTYGKNGSKYDDLESSFKAEVLANKKNPNSARGLTQITKATRKILGDEKGELKNHFIKVTNEELNDPSTNICAGIRWLFHKRKLASSKLQREASWNETMYEFKGLKTAPKERADDILKTFTDELEKHNNAK